MSELLLVISDILVYKNYVIKFLVSIARLYSMSWELRLSNEVITLQRIKIL